MNRGLLKKSFREMLPATVLCGVALLLFEALFAYAIHVFGSDLTEQWGKLLESRFLQGMLQSLLGTDIGSRISPLAFSSIAWVHPIVLALVWAHEISICTRVPAGEVDRGTIDILFSLPVSRWSVYVCESIAWATAGLVVLIMGMVGAWLGDLTVPVEARVDLGRLLVIVANLFCLYLVVGAMTLLVSSLSERRGRAVAVAFGIVILSFLLNFLAQFWTPAKTFSFLGILHYYKPFLILKAAAWPVRDMVILTGTAVVLWVAGGVVFSRRDVCTV